MKKILFLLAIALPLMFSSCSKDDDPSATTYTIKCDLEDHSVIETTITVFEYTDSGEKVGTNSVTAQNGLTKAFTANEKTEKVKVYVKMDNGIKPSYNWVQQVYYLEKEKNTDIELTGKTMLGSKEP